MNKIQAVITGIDSSGNLHRVSLAAGDEVFTAITLELGKDYTVGASVEIHFKSAHVALAKNVAGEVSIANRVKATVLELQRGKLLTDILLGSNVGEFYALTTTEAVARMDISPGDTVTALMKASDLYLSKAEEQ